VPYDAVLFLGNAADSKSLASFMRYYDVSNKSAKFYGTIAWDTKDMFGDLTMNGAIYPALPPMNEDFVKLYSEAMLPSPSRLGGFGFDAANLARGAVNSYNGAAAYLLNPSGYKGLDGLIRLRPNGMNQRALQIMELNGSGTPKLIADAPTNFVSPIYQMEIRDNGKPSEITLKTNGINPNDYIKIPEDLRWKYRSKTYGYNQSDDAADDSVAEEITILPEDDSEVVTNPDFKPTHLDTVTRKMVDEVSVRNSSR
jgi:hypothetical protein